MTHLFLYGIALLCLSQSASMVKYAAAPPEVIGTWRLLLASGFFLLVSLGKGHLKVELRTASKNLTGLAWTGVFFFLHLWTFFYASQTTRISHTMILFCLNPLFVAAGRWWLDQRKPSPRLVISYVLSLVALSLLLLESGQQSNLSLSRQALWGDGAALASAVFFAAYFLLNHRSRQHFSNSVFSGVMYGFCGLCFFVTMALRQDNWMNYPSHTWVGIGAQVLFPTLLGHALISYLMKFLDPTWMATGKLVEPILATFVAALVFQEPVGSQTVLAFLLTGVALLFFLKSRSAATAPSVEPR